MQPGNDRLVVRFERNVAGRDFVVGDIHGHFARLQTHLDEMGFDPSVDRLFCTGDLVDRGPDSEACVDWLARPWFHSVRGNHDQWVIDRVGGHRVVGLHRMNGGLWFDGITTEEKHEIAVALEAMPVMIEIETALGRIGIVHAEVDGLDWEKAKAHVLGGNQRVIDRMMYSRRRIDAKDCSVVDGVDLVVAGHTPVPVPTLMGNTFYIDTGLWKGGPVSVIQVDPWTWGLA